MSVILISGITGNDKKNNVKNGLKSILGAIIFNAWRNLCMSDITSSEVLIVNIPPTSREIDASTTPPLQIIN